MKSPIFKGMATAMVTPMTATGVDYDALARFIDFQLESGINALVAVGRHCYVSSIMVMRSAASTA